MRKTLVHFSMFALLVALMVPAVACQKKADEGTEQMQQPATTEQAPAAGEGGEATQGGAGQQMGEGMESTGEMGKGMENTGQMGTDQGQGNMQDDNSGNMKDDNSGN